MNGWEIFIGKKNERIILPFKQRYQIKQTYFHHYEYITQQNEGAKFVKNQDTQGNVIEYAYIWAAIVYL